MTFGKLLKEIRLGFSNIGLIRYAKLVNIKPSIYSAIEHGRIKPIKVELICDKLGLSSDDDRRKKLLDLEKSYKQEKNLGEENIIPAFVCTVDGKPLSDDKLVELTEWIKKKYYSVPSPQKIN